LDFNRIYQLALRLTAGLLVLFIFLGTVIYKENSTTNGLVFGTLVSIIYVFFLANRLRKIEQVPLDRLVGYMRAGSIMRFSLIIISLFLIFHSPKYNLTSAGIGLLTGPAMITLVGFINAFIRTRKGSE
jgi:hypothetical protein